MCRIGATMRARLRTEAQVPSPSCGGYVTTSRTAHHCTRYLDTGSGSLGPRSGLIVGRTPYLAA